MFTHLESNRSLVFVDSWMLSMKYMHGMDPPLVHRDLKTPNVMIASVEYNDEAVAKGPILNCSL